MTMTDWLTCAKSVGSNCGSLKGLLSEGHLAHVRLKNGARARIF
jgi:hypothetical protein